jgi:hypothetical protein
VAIAIHYGNEMRSEMIVCLRFDPQLQRQQRRVQFDSDARDAAIAEADRMQAEIDGEPEAPS